MTPVPPPGGRDDEAAARLSSMQRNPALEALLAELNAVLAPANARLDVDVAERLPKVFVVGAMRSGTTLYMQWLASTGLVAYPTNLLSRFHGAPWIGARIQQLLTDPAYRFRDEMLGFEAPVDFRSDNGKTTGALAPNEFWYFWRRLLPGLAEQYQPSDVLRRTSDLGALREQVDGLANIFGRPFAMKALILDQNLDLLAEAFAKPVFAWVRRDPVFNIQSVLAARARQYGTMDRWYSFRIKEFPRLRDLDPLHAVAGQVYAMNTHVERALAAMPEHHQLLVDYESFCAAPGAAYDALVARLRAHGAAADAPAYAGVEAFACANEWTLDRYSRREAEAAYATMRDELGDCA